MNLASGRLPPDFIAKNIVSMNKLKSNSDDSSSEAEINEAIYRSGWKDKININNEEK